MIVEFDKSVEKSIDKDKNLCIKIANRYLPPLPV